MQLSFIYILKKRGRFLMVVLLKWEKCFYFEVLLVLPIGYYLPY